MKNIFKVVFKAVAGFFTSPVKVSFFLIFLLSLLAVAEYFYLGLARRTFVFYTLSDGIITVEDRMLKHSRSQEDNIIQYVEETLLGPVSPDLLPIITKGTKLISLLFRDGVVYANFSQSAALPPLEGGNTKDNFLTFHDSILRNFSYVNDVRFFIEGNSVFSYDFQQDIQDETDGFSGV